VTIVLSNPASTGRDEAAEFSFRHVPTGILVSASEMFRALQLLSLGVSRVHVRHSMETEFRMEFLARAGRPTVKITPLTQLPEGPDKGVK